MPPDLAEVAARLEHERPLPSGEELERMRVRALQAHRIARAPLTRPSPMRTRAVLVAMIALGALMSAGGGALALSGSPDAGSAGQAVYPPPPQGQIVLGEEELPSTTGPGDTVEELAPTIDEIQSGTPSEAQQPAQEDALGAERELAFTGLAALPLLLAGVVLILAGLLLSRRAGGRPA